MLFLSNAKQGHLAFTVGLEDYIPSVCPECPLPSQPVGAEMSFLHSWNQCCEGEDVAPRRGQVGRRRKPVSVSHEAGSYSNLASALKVKSIGCSEKWMTNFILSKNIAMASSPSAVTYTVQSEE